MPSLLRWNHWCAGAIAATALMWATPNEAIAQTTLLSEQHRLDQTAAVLEGDGSRYREHSFQGAAGQRVTIRLESRDFDTYLFLLDSDGNVLAQNDDDTTSTNSEIVATLPRTGTYYIIANAYDANGRGQYRLTVTADDAETTTRSPAPAPSGLPSEMLNAHNRWRQQVGVPPLQWSNELADYAQAWANQLAEDDRFEHRPNNRYGENLAYFSGQRATASRVVDLWGNEVADYDYSSNRCTGVCGHYTQIVWKTTTEVGCAVARAGNEEYWVCNYNPPGNYVGQRPY